MSIVLTDLMIHLLGTYNNHQYRINECIGNSDFGLTSKISIFQIKNESKVQLYEFYRDINPAKLTGAIDIVEDKDGRLSYSPYHKCLEG